MKIGHARAVLGIGAILMGVAFAARTSANPDALGRYSLVYFFLLVSYLPVLAGAVSFWIAGDDVGRGTHRVMRSPTFWVVLFLILLPAAGVLARFASERAPGDVLRAAVLVGMAAGYALAAIGLAGRSTERGLRRFQAVILVVLGGIYVTTFSITPLLGAWIERTHGLPAQTTLRVTKPREFDSRLIHEPNASLVYTGPPRRVREFAVEVRNNSWGFHDRERTFEAPGDRPRIVVLGDSYVQALEVPRDSAFPALLEERLTRDLPGLEVIRIARRAIGQAGELELLQEYGARLRPQLVILTWSTDDLLDNDPELAALGTWVPDAVLFPGLLLDRLAVKWLRERLYHVGDQYRLGALRPDHWAYLEPMPPAVTAAFARTETLLDRIVAECETMGSELLIVIRRPTNELRWLRRFPGLRAYRINTDAHAEWLESYAASRGARFLDLGPPFQTYYDAHPTGHPEQYTWPQSGSLREPGHRLAAELIHEKLVHDGIVARWSLAAEEH